MTEPQRKRLPDERTGLTRSEHLAAVGGAKVEITTGEYENGSLGEIFLRVDKEGSVLRAYEMTAIAISIGLQYGVPLKVFIDKFKHQQLEPAGMTSDPDIPIADSIIDFVAKFLEKEYLLKGEKNE
jgi:ribonucleoside-diphosphate reductase alpha chain